CLQDYSHPWTF
nr:immunoglobulin light chain junction region [Macaca mulatta]